MSSGLGLPPDVFMCCVCFTVTLVEDAWRDDDGQRWDICSTECAAKTRHARCSACGQQPWIEGHAADCTAPPPLDVQRA